MTDHNHPLTETAAAKLWDTHVGDTVPWEDWYGGSRRALTALLRAAHDAGRKHERAAAPKPCPRCARRARWARTLARAAVPVSIGAAIGAMIPTP